MNHFNHFICQGQKYRFADENRAPGITATVIDKHKNGFEWILEWQSSITGKTWVNQWDEYNMRKSMICVCDPYAVKLNEDLFEIWE